LVNYQTILQEIAEVQVGYQARGRIEEDLDGEYTIIRSQDFSEDGGLNFAEAMRFRPALRIDPRKHLLTVGDILLQARGLTHQAYLIDEPLENAVAANTFYIIKILDEKRVLPAYLTWWINQPNVQNYFEQERGVSTIPFISKKVLLDAPVRIPPIDTQNQISKLVALWHREQTLLNDLNYNKDRLIHAVARRAVADSLEEN